MSTLTELTTYDRETIWGFLSENAQKLYYNVSYCDELSVPFEIQSEDFLKIAKDDLDKENVESLVNALSNIKRAIDCRIATVWYAFGLYGLSKSEHWKFPQSADLLCKLGIVSPNILKKINNRRNELEHDFKRPTKLEILDFFDTAVLFLESNRNHLRDNYELEIAFIDGKDYPWLAVDLNTEEERLAVTYWIGYKNGKRFELTIKQKADYLSFLILLIDRIVKRP